MAFIFEDHIERVLWTDQQISDRVSQLASEITRDFTVNGATAVAALPSAAPVVVGVATGAFLFLADLVRKINLPITVDVIRVESYGSGTVSSGKPKISCDLKIDVRGKHVILVEDIVDTGNTLCRLIEHLKSKGASSISVCALLDKPSRRKVNFELVGDGKFYRGFECPDYFVVGYGLDFAELYRNLPYVGVLKPEVYK
nr:hypoxanthine-guanine phosphoribosyltransferase [Ipomoea batatas]GMD91176.1 hypoxanthine-guanine phosphoribosyltransferase [Ipomoea batatas]GME04780.1 hypoxanthine-guanine phosphoribosyltransferase [Ipomoea batatas]